MSMARFGDEQGPRRLRDSGGSQSIGRDDQTIHVESQKTATLSQWTKPDLWIDHVRHQQVVVVFSIASRCEHGQSVFRLRRKLVLVLGGIQQGSRDNLLEV